MWRVAQDIYTPHLSPRSADLFYFWSSVSVPAIRETPGLNYHKASTALPRFLLSKCLQCRKAVVGWFADALLVNTPAEASNPDPRKAASSEFLMNVSVALLELAMPIIRDESKFNKVSIWQCFYVLCAKVQSGGGGGGVSLSSTIDR